MMARENDIVDSSLDENRKAFWIPLEDAWTEVPTIWEVNSVNRIK